MFIKVLLFQETFPTLRKFVVAHLISTNAINTKEHTHKVGPKPSKRRTRYDKKNKKIQQIYKANCENLDQLKIGDEK